MISRNVIKRIVDKEMKFWLRLEKDNFFLC